MILIIFDNFFLSSQYTAPRCRIKQKKIIFKEKLVKPPYSRSFQDYKFPIDVITGFNDMNAAH